MEIVVLGKPNVYAPANYYNPAPSPTFLNQQQKVIFAYGIDNVSVEPEVTDNEIVVTAQRLKDHLSTYIISTIARASTNYSLPCVGPTKGSEIASIMQRLKFKVTNTDFGPGRAGANGVGAEDGSVPVEINAEALKVYGQNPSGLSFLIAHELAHALKSMQEYNQVMWNQYVAGPGAKLSHAQRVAQYPDSSQFSKNEARANTVAKAILSKLGQTVELAPKHGYQIC